MEMRVCPGGGWTPFFATKPGLYFPIRSNRASIAASFVSTSSR